MMVVQIELFGVFGLTNSESKTDIMCMPMILRTPAKQMVFNATGQQYHRHTTSFVYLGSSVTETPNLSAEIDQRIRLEWISFRYHTRKLYDCPKAIMLHPKAQMVKLEVV